jgi:riboflavin synthase
MFTGIIEQIGIVEATSSGRLTFSASMAAELRLGESVAVNGVCLTAAALTPTTFSCDLSEETLRLTDLDGLRYGDRVNLERAMRLSDRLGGHLVSGHVEGIGVLRERQEGGQGTLVTVELPDALMKYCVRKGSIALDGVSLTINDLTPTGVCVTLIPHTLKMTTFGFKGVGERINIECDLLAKYVERLTTLRRGKSTSPMRSNIFVGPTPSSA